MGYLAPLALRRTTAAAGRALPGCLALGLLAGGLAGCNVLLPGRVTHYTPDPAALQDKVDCTVPSEWRPGYGPTASAAQLMGSVPPGFVPVDAVECTFDFSVPARTATPGPPRMVERHLSGDFAPLLAALAQPSDRQDGIACTADGEIVPSLWLVNAAGKAVHVTWPVDACGKTRGKPDTAKALAGLKTVSAKPLEVQVAP
ncbi:hypothetical protein QO003_003957 [Arthrobacter silviterrae]|uniref:DUF3558 domain-containing protein n=1 Tax=Arthrobacter silviterrae TaxID=2026658 RepID=A0ABX0D7F9_9MICC|nr:MULTISPECIES: hypothetical protein [Arthrobacter]MCU6479487.1 hypothetical protein [Arthrobacter sp. A2-55]MDQ0279654.1 hypothetical protein [Arthrobacter silviterrae]NGN81870.1 hypothetical protein [Arthrobacter silviterrae]